jgi:hypothetical protein
MMSQKTAAILQENIEDETSCKTPQIVRMVAARIHERFRPGAELSWRQLSPQ